MCDQEQRWSELCRRCYAVTGADEGWARLVALYSTPPRAYHNLNHVEDCLRQLERLNDRTVEIEAVEMALWWHDCVYDSRVKDNEAQSALRWIGFANDQKLAAKFRNEVALLIQITDHRSAAVDPAAKLIQDVDLSILGRERLVFADYERRIREEYSWVSETDYATGRSLFLNKLLGRPRLFLTERGLACFEAVARENIVRALTELRA